MTDAYLRARGAIDAIHAQDPELRDGRPAELVYADAVEAWLLRLIPDAEAVLRLAARAQHLERWSLPRSAYPQDRPGYHRWRTEQYRRQGALARTLCVDAGLSEADALRVEALVAKTRLAEVDGQAIEDAACLVFLDREIEGFAANHSDYTPERYIDILRKTMRKMSAAAREAALTLPLPEPFAGLVRTAATSLRTHPAA
jgi:hypothetical protein